MVIRRMGLLLIWLSGFIAGCAGTGFAAQAELRLPTYVTVGSGYVVVEADRVVISVGIETHGKSAAEAHFENEGVVNAIRARLSRVGPEGLALSERRVNIWERRRTATRTDRGGYRATSGLDISISDDARVGRVIDVAMGLGASSIQGVKFRVSDLTEATRRALSLAVKDAIARAETISKATGMRIVRIRRVNDANTVQVINPSDPVIARADDAPNIPHPLPVRGEVAVRVQVTVEFEVAVQ